MNEENNVNQEGSADQQPSVDQPTEPTQVEATQPTQESAEAVTEAIPAPPQSPYEAAPAAPIEEVPAPAPVPTPEPAVAPAPEAVPAPAPASYAAPDATQAQPPMQPTEPQQPTSPYSQEQPTQTYGTPVQTPDQSQTQQAYPAYGTQQVDYSQQAGYYAQPAPAQPSSGKAMGALICGILAILFSSTVLIGIILGIIAIVLAGQYVKSFGKDSKATGGKITGIIGIVFSTLALIGYIVLGVWVASVSTAAYDYYDDYYNEYTYSDEDDSFDLDSDSDGISGYGDLVDEAEAVQEFDKIMGEIKVLSDEELLSKIAESYNKDLKDWYGITLEDMGIDPKEVITFSLGEMSYELDSYSSYSYSTGDELSLDGYVACADSFDVMMAFSDMLYEKDIYSSDLSDQDMSMVKELYLEAAKSAEPTYEKYIYFDMVKNEAGEWALEADALENVIESIFSIY